jgi:hypothetical protein
VPDEEGVMKLSIMGLKDDREVKMETRKLREKTIIAILTILCTATISKATFVDANAVEEGIEYYIRIDKDVYQLGEAIEMMHRLTNVGEQTLNVYEISFYTYRLELTRPEGDTIFAQYFGPPFPPMPPGLPDIITLNPGEYMEWRWDITSKLNTWGIDGEWVEEPFATVGQYSVSSKYNGYIFTEPERPVNIESGPLDFFIIPEPASIALLGLASAFLLVRRKERVKCSS